MPSCAYLQNSGEVLEIHDSALDLSLCPLADAIRPIREILGSALGYFACNLSPVSSNLTMVVCPHCPILSDVRLQRTEMPLSKGVSDTKADC